MKGFLNLLAKAKLIELSEDERLAASAEPPQEALAARPETRAEAPVLPRLREQASEEPKTMPAASALPSLAEACPDLDGDALEGHAFEDIFAAAQVPASPTKCLPRHIRPKSCCAFSTACAPWMREPARWRCWRWMRPSAGDGCGR